jgi:hypothetical protein
MVIKAWGPLFGWLVLAGAGIHGLIVDHPEPHNRGQPTEAPCRNSPEGKRIIVGTPKPNDGERKQESNWYDKPTDWLLALFTGILALYTRRLYQATAGLFKETSELRRIADDQRMDLSRSIAAAEQSATAAIDQVSLSKEALITTERAFVYCERIHTIWTAVKETDLVTKWTFHPIWKNSGKTPTKRAINKNNWWLGINVGDIPPNFDFTNADGPGRTMIGPDATMSGSGPGITAEDLQKMRDGAAHAYLWGWIDYDDIFANTQRHRTEFCIEIQVTGNPIYKECGFAYRVHGRFNGFDEECYSKPKPY